MFPINMLHLVSPSNVNLFIISCSVYSMHLIPYSPCFEPRLSTIPAPALGLANRKIRSFSGIRPSRH